MMTMWAEFPQRKCRIAVQLDPIAHLCEVQEHHPGPCASPSLPPTVSRREQWEAANPGWRGMSEFGDPFAEVKP